MLVCKYMLTVLAEPQAPRLTTMLRAFTSSGQSQPDLDAQYLERSKLLAAKQKVKAGRLEPCLVAQPVWDLPCEGDQKA